MDMAHLAQATRSVLGMSGECGIARSQAGECLV